ncbi:MAG: hypothetical protein EXR98_07255 [Gemmataceae bacterium]|nr:hypothetical protein [Gemmataceae bacterium]
MTTCQTCRDRLLDHAYGLLEGSDLQDLRAHLSHCTECQAALEEVRAEQQMLANAAKAITVVPAFVLPTDQPAAIPETLPMSAAPSRKQSSWRRTWIAWSAAAAVLIAVGVSLSYYRQTVHGLKSELAAKREEYKKASEEFAALPVKYETLQEAAIREIRGNTDAYLHVVGPTTLTAGARGHLHIATRSRDGKPAKADLRIKLMETEPGGKMKVLHWACDHQTIAELDATWAKPNSALKLLVEADVGLAKARVQETVRTLANSYATRLDTNKIAYQYRDVLFFRVLVLDRYTLLSPSEPIAMRVELLDPAGKAVRSLTLPTGDGGILAREFAIDEKFQTGTYTLSACPVDPTRTDVQPVSQRLEVVRELILPELVFDQERYRAGEQLSGIYRGPMPLPEKAMIGNHSVPITKAPAFDAFGGPGGAGGAPIAKADNKKALAKAVPLAQPFTAQIPPNLPAGASRVQISMKIGEGKQQKEVKADIQLAPTEFSIDFFPEGGDLIAGIENRVYYRVRSKSGEPVTGDGSVILLSSKNDVVDSTYHLGMGYFEFTPSLKETYTVRITTPVKTENIANPFAALGMRGDGVVVHVPNAVGAQGDPIRMTLRQQGPARKLLLVAQCRGQIVDQRWVEIKNKSVDLTLLPTRDAVGMIRVTAYEPQDNQADQKDPLLVPVAERLVYRSAAQRLDLGFKLNTQQLHGGQKLSAKITARDEKGQPAPAWLLASVIDERFQAQPRSLSAHFFLLNEIRSGADLDNAQLILHDSPESVAVLERFLGTHGWRRFVRSQEPSLGLLADPAKRPHQPLVFSRENQPLEGLQADREAKLDRALAKIRQTGFEEKDTLTQRCDSLAQAVTTAGANLHGFEETVQVWFRLGLGMLVALLLAVSLIFMGVGVYRIVRAHKLATPSFSGAFACLTACIGVLFLGAWLGPLSVIRTGRMLDVEPAAREVDRQLGQAFAQAPFHGPIVEKPLTGNFALQISTLAERKDRMVAAKGGENEYGAKDAGKALRASLENSLARRGGRSATNALLTEAKSDSQTPAANLAMDAKFKQLLKEVEKGSLIAPIPAPPPTKPGVEPKLPMAMALADREYAHKHVPGLLADTLLWHPTLLLPNGSAVVQFDMANGQATYRVMLLGHNTTGRFGFHEMRLDVPEVGR